MNNEFRSYDSWLEAPYHRRYDDYDMGTKKKKKKRRKKNDTEQKSINCGGY